MCDEVSALELCRLLLMDIILLVRYRPVYLFGQWCAPEGRDFVSPLGAGRRDLVVPLPHWPQMAVYEPEGRDACSPLGPVDESE